MHLFISLLLSTPCLALVYESPDALPSTSFDFVIVGAGAAGSVLANRLTEDPKISVLLLEAGPSNTGVIDSLVPAFPALLNPNTPFDWNYTTTPQVGLDARSVVYPRGHMLGGSTSVNFMGYTRGSFEEWDRYANLTGDPGWSWDNTQQYLRLNERWTPPADHHNTTGQFDPIFHSVTGINPVSLPGFPRSFDPHIIATTAENPGQFPFNIDQSSGFPLGVGWPQSTIGDGVRASAATSYLGARFIARPNLHVLVNARVTRILQTGVEKGKPAFRGVEFTESESAPRMTVQATKEVVLSAGSVGTPAILMLSGIGNEKDLSALGIKTIVNNPSVGANLTDHPLLPNVWFINSTATTFDELNRNESFAAEAFARWNDTRTGPLVVPPIAHLVWLKLPESMFDAFGIRDPSAGPHTGNFELIFLNGWARFGTPLPDGNFMTIVTAVTAPTSVGSITLNTSNPFDAPNINPNLLGTDFDLQAMVHALATARDYVKAKTWSGYVIGEFDDLAAAQSVGEIEAYIRANSGSIFHPAGTAGMSPKGASFGVVDPDLVAKGIEGLRIADTSVLPIVPSAHTQVPTYVVGERAAALIKIQYGLE